MLLCGAKAIGVVQKIISLGQSLSICPCDDGRMKRKQQFLRAIQILAPGDTFILKAAQRVPEESLPVYSGGAALELVVAMQKLLSLGIDDSSTRDWEEPRCHRREGRDQDQLSMSHALRIQNAHYWLKLGEADQALWELKALSSKAVSHPSALKARLAVLRAAREMNEVTVKE